MNYSSDASVINVLKSDHQRSGKDHKMHLTNVAKTKAVQRINEDMSAQMIQRAWLSYVDKVIFQLLKHTICAAEHCVTHEILKKVSPLEAELVKDPGMKCKVRFRFSGEIFPPLIVFKIFLHTEGHGYKYFSGKKILQPSSEAVVNACKIMGEKKFYGQIMEDECLFQRFRITDEIDIVTMQDYMQYSSLLDETPAHSGGRNNYWRRLSLENIPRTMIMYDIVNYAESGIISSRLQKELKYLLQKPRTEEMHQHQLRIVSEVRCPSPSSITSPLYRPYKQKSQVKHLGRRSKKTLLKVEKMRNAYKMDKEKNASVVTEPQKDTSSTKQQAIIISTPDFDIVKVQEPMSDEEMKKKQKELFAWSQELCMNNPPTF